jgi:tetratricopeptide (TPR) repeat protein
LKTPLALPLPHKRITTTPIKHYKLALRAKDDYPVAINNLAFAQEKLLKYEEAIALYKKTLELEPNNSTAKKGIKKLEKRS